GGGLQLQLADRFFGVDGVVNDDEMRVEPERRLAGDGAGQPVAAGRVRVIGFAGLVDADLDFGEASAVLLRLDYVPGLRREVERQRFGVRGDDVPRSCHPRPGPAWEQDRTDGAFGRAGTDVDYRVVLFRQPFEYPLGDGLKL